MEELACNYTGVVLDDFEFVTADCAELYSDLNRQMFDLNNLNIYDKCWGYNITGYR